MSESIQGDRPFNEGLDRPAVFKDITPEGQKAQEDYMKSLLDETRKDLGLLSEEQD